VPKCRSFGFGKAMCIARRKCITHKILIEFCKVLIEMRCSEHGLLCRGIRNMSHCFFLIHLFPPAPAFSARSAGKASAVSGDRCLPRGGNWITWQQPDVTSVFLKDGVGLRLLEKGLRIYAKKHDILIYLIHVPSECVRNWLYRVSSVWWSTFVD